ANIAAVCDATSFEPRHAPQTRISRCSGCEDQPQQSSGGKAWRPCEGRCQISSARTPTLWEGVVGYLDQSGWAKATRMNGSGNTGLAPKLTSKPAGNVLCSAMARVPRRWAPRCGGCESLRDWFELLRGRSATHPC